MQFYQRIFYRFHGEADRQFYMQTCLYATGDGNDIEDILLKLGKTKKQIIMR